MNTKPTSMQSKTVAELRALAKAKGISGYSRMRKDELLQALTTQPRTTAPRAAATATTQADTKRTSQAREQARATSVIKPTAGTGAEPQPMQQMRTTAAVDDEQRIEDAKFATTPPDRIASTTEFSTDLGETIDVLPPLTGAAISLLPQKPGILHAYWVLEPGRLQRQPGLKLRLSYASPQRAHILHEIGLSSERGHWYFHIDPHLEQGEVYLQLGHYREDGTFATAIRRGIVRLPRLGASSHTDRSWWVSEEEFRGMYLRAGGVSERGRLMWSDSMSSINNLSSK
jgi:hypothetical protein